MPDISFILFVQHQRERGARALKSLLEQTIIDRTEILVLDFALSGTTPIEGSDHPRVRVLHCDANSSMYEIHQARLYGATHATADYVAYLEEHCVANEPAYAETLLRVAQQGFSVVCPRFIGLDMDNPQAFALFVTSYIHVNAPYPQGELYPLAGANLCYHRETLLHYAKDKPYYLSLEGLLHERMKADGLRLGFTPHASISHANMLKPANYWSLAWIHARFSNLIKIQDGEFTLWDRVIRVFGTPLVPFVRTARIVHRTRKTGYGWGILIKSVPYIFGGQLVGAISQTITLLGATYPCNKEFFYIEMNVER